MSRLQEAEALIKQELASLEAAHQKRLLEMERKEAAAAERLQELLAIKASMPAERRILDLGAADRSIAEKTAHLKVLEVKLEKLESRIREAVDREEKLVGVLTERRVNLEHEVHDIAADAARQREECRKFEEQRDLRIKNAEAMYADAVRLARKDSARHLEELERLEKASNEAVEALLLLGNRKGAMEAEIRQAEQTRETLQQEIERLRAADPASDTLLEVIGEIIKMIDFADTAQRFISQRTVCEGTRVQFVLLRKHLVTLLTRLDVAEVVVEPGAPVDIAMRSQISVHRHLGGDGRTVVHSMVLPGYASRNGRGSMKFHRKPEIITATEEILTRQS